MALVLAFGMSVPVTSAHAAGELAAAAISTNAASDTSAADNTFTFSNGGVSAANDSEGYTISGSELTISADGTYILKGSSSQGKVTVEDSVTAKLVLDGSTQAFSLANAQDSTIQCGKKSNVAIVVRGTATIANTVADGKAIQAKANSTLTLSGTAGSTLNVNATYNAIKGAKASTVNLGASTSDGLTLNIAAGNNGAAADGTLVVWGGTLNLGTSSTPIGNDGLKSKPDGDDEKSGGEVIVRGGTTTIYSTGDGVQADFETEYTDDNGATQTTDKSALSQGKATIAGGTLNIMSGCDGVQAADTLAVYGGTVNVTANGGATTKHMSNEDSCKGLKSDKLVLVQGGTFNLNTADDCIHSDGNVELYGGTFTLKTHNASTKPDNMNSWQSSSTTVYEKGGDAVHADYVTKIGKINGTTGLPKITVESCYEGLEGAEVRIYDGTIDITATDDGINAANGDLSNYSFAMLFAGGTTSVNSGSDGIDSNGDIYVTGGTTYVSGASTGDGDAVDYGDSNSKFVVSGGTIVAYGQGGQMMGGGFGGFGGNQQSSGSFASTPTEGYYVEFGSSTGMGGGMMGPGGEQFGGFDGNQNGQQQGGPNGQNGQGGFNGQRPDMGFGQGRTSETGNMGGMQQQAAVASAGTLVPAGTAFSVATGSATVQSSALKDASYILVAGDPVGGAGVSCTLTANGTTTTATSAGSKAASTYTPKDALTANESAAFGSTATSSGIDVTYSGTETNGSSGSGSGSGSNTDSNTDANTGSDSETGSTGSNTGSNSGSSAGSSTDTGANAGTGTNTSSTIDLSKAKVSTILKKSYTGGAIKPKPTVTVNGTKLKLGTDYTLTYKNNKKVGTATVYVKAAENSTKYTGSTKKTFKIVKAANPMKVISTARTISAASLTNSAQALKALYVTGAKGATTYTRVSGSNFLNVDKSTGKIKVAKGTAAGTYTIRVKITAAGNNGYKTKSVTKAVKVTVR